MQDKTHEVNCTVYLELHKQLLSYFNQTYLEKQVK